MFPSLIAWTRTSRARSSSMYGRCSIAAHLTRSFGSRQSSSKAPADSGYPKYPAIFTADSRTFGSGSCRSGMIRSDIDGGMTELSALTAACLIDASSLPIKFSSPSTACWVSDLGECICRINRQSFVTKCIYQRGRCTRSRRCVRVPQRLTVSLPDLPLPTVRSVDLTVAGPCRTSASIISSRRSVRPINRVSARSTPDRLSQPRTNAIERKFSLPGVSNASSRF